MTLLARFDPGLTIKPTMECSVDDEINAIKMKRPHVVLVGAGASRAAFPSGDANGKPLPLMTDFLEIVPVKDLLERHGVATAGRNFEDLYSRLHDNPQHAELLKQLEGTVLDYFSSLQLPETPTIYDQLVLSLRPKDVIATFNWDPFLIQAVQRNRNIIKGPLLLFLHGNVLEGFCVAHKTYGLIGNACRQCSQPLQRVPLLFPIGKKDYNSEPAIKLAWDALHAAFEDAFMVTVFGYGAPQSDVEAIALLKKAWGDKNDRSMEEFEIIDIRKEDDLRDSWDAFIHSHHYQTYSAFADSWIANHPRRTGEAYIHQFLDALFIDNNPVPRCKTLRDLQDWYTPLLKREAKE